MERIQLLKRFYSSSGSTIYKDRAWEVTIPKLTGMELEDAALELNRLGLDIGSVIVPDHDNFRGTPPGIPHIIIYQNPSPETIVPMGSLADIYGGYIWR
jgi:beta-lactam-binding protein with PASTA domain